MERYNLQIWAYIFQVIEAESIKNPMLPPQGIKRAKGEAYKPPEHTLTMAEAIPEDFMSKEGKVMATWTKAWYHRDQEQKKTLRGNRETSFNDILDKRAAIRRELQEGTIQDYAGTLWEVVSMANNGKKKGVTLELQENGFLEQIKSRANTETSNTKSELRAARQGTEIGDQERYKVTNLKVKQTIFNQKW